MAKHVGQIAANPGPLPAETPAVDSQPHARQYKLRRRLIGETHPEPMSLSVIVTSYNTPDTLTQCLASLVQQPSVAEIIVADCSRQDPTEAIHAVYPRVRVLHFTSKKSIPGLRWAAAWQAQGDVIAATEARLIPAADWCAELVRAHALDRDAPVIGGPVRLKPLASQFDWGLYLCEYGAFGPPIAEGAVRQLSSANLSYKRAALEESRDLLDAGCWETSMHERWLRQGRRLGMCSATIVFQNGLGAKDAFSMRFQNGRSYSAERAIDWSHGRRLVFAAGCVLLPWLLTWRLVRAAYQKSYTWPFWASLPWVLALNTAWAAGELVGYLAGRSSRPHIF